MKTAISVPDQIYEEAERLAQQMKKSRSQLYSEAMAEYLTRHDSESVTERMNRACQAAGAPDDGWGNAAARQVLERTEW